MGDEQRDGHLLEALGRRPLQKLLGIVAEIGRSAAVILIEARVHHGGFHPVPLGPIKLRMRQVAGDQARAGGLAPERHPIGIAAVLRDVRLHPAHHRGHVLVRRRPGVLRGQAIVHVDADHALLREPEHDVVVEGRSGLALVAALEAAAMDVDHPVLPAPGPGGEHVELVGRIRAIRDIARDSHVRIGLLLLREQRRVELGGARRVDDRPDLPEFPRRCRVAPARAAAPETLMSATSVGIMMWIFTTAPP